MRSPAWCALIVVSLSNASDQRPLAAQVPKASTAYLLPLEALTAITEQNAPIGRVLEVRAHVAHAPQGMAYLRTDPISGGRTDRDPATQAITGAYTFCSHVSTASPERAVIDIAFYEATDETIKYTPAPPDVRVEVDAHGNLTTTPLLPEQRAALEVAVHGVGGHPRPSQAAPRDVSVSFTESRHGLSAMYVVSDGGEIVERCQEDRYPDRSLRLECTSARGVTIRIDNEVQQAHYEFVGGTWTRYYLSGTPGQRLIIPGYILERLVHDDRRCKLLDLLPDDHRRAFVWKSGGPRETIVIPSLDMLQIWQRRDGDEVMELTAVSMGTPIPALTPPDDADVRVDRRARRVRLF